MIAPELKPCPFCKSRGIDRDLYWHRNYCTNCGARGPAAGNTVNADWNTRADLCDPTQDERVKALVDAAIAEYTAANKRVTSRERKQYIRGRIEALKDLRAALAQQEGAKG